MNYSSNLNDLTKEQKEIAFVIERTNYIEYQIKEIITTYLQTNKSKRDFVKNILLNNGILNLGAKIKLLMYISDNEGWNIDKDIFHRIITIRNAFAHNDTVHENISITMINKNEVNNVEFYMTLDTVKSSGKLERIKRQDALQEFTNKYVVAKDFLDGIRKKINTEKETV